RMVNGGSPVSGGWFICACDLDHGGFSRNSHDRWVQQLDDASGAAPNPRPPAARGCPSPPLASHRKAPPPSPKSGLMSNVNQLLRVTPPCGVHTSEPRWNR